MSKVISTIIFSMVIGSFCSAQQKTYGTKLSGNTDIISDVFLVPDGFSLDSVASTAAQATYRFEYDGNGKLKRDINFRFFTKVSIINGRPTVITMPGARDYYYNESGFVDSVKYMHWDDNMWVNDSSGYKIRYDSDGRVKSIIYSTKDSVTTVKECSYDSIGNPVFETSRTGLDTTSVIREYDRQNRLTLRKYYYPQSFFLYEYRYDSLGNITCPTYSISSGDTTSGWKYYLQFDESGKLIYEQFVTVNDTFDIMCDYNDYGNILKMGSIVRFHYDVDGNLDSLVNLHSVDCGYLGNTATLIDSYRNTIKLPSSGFNKFYYHSMVTGIKTNTVIEKTFTLSQNYPNPFNPSTNISFTLPTKSFVTLKVYDLLGRGVATLVEGELSAGNHSQEWNATNFASGVYFCRLQAGKYSATKKLLLIR